MKSLCLILLLSSAITAYGQTYSVRGEVLDEKAQSLVSAAAVLLNPSDSTLLYLAISGNAGKFELRNVKKGHYLLQVSLLGYTTFYHPLDVPVAGDEIGQVLLTPKTFAINEVTISGERIPMRIKKDTIEYDAKAYKVKPDGDAEDLISKLPGVEVDRAGNIKAMGEDVNNVLVDGKEFFGNDPKVATRNLPADAIDKVQLFDRQTDESRFTGIDDGERNPTLNLVLDKDKKKGIFGELTAGAGTEGRTQEAAKVYRFTQKSQFAALGLYNNINQPGFSIGDYINFSGGLSRFSSGDGHIMIGGENSFPVNFGQPVYGKGSNGAGGINFSVSGSGNDRFFISYLGNGSKRKVNELSATRNYVPDGSFLVQSDQNETKTDTAHRFNLGLRKNIGQRQNVIVNGGFTYNSSSNPFMESSESFRDELLINSLQRKSGDIMSGLSGNADMAYLLKINEGKTIFRISGKAGITGSRTDDRYETRTEFLNPYNLEIKNRFYNLATDTRNYNASISLTQKLTRRSFIDLSLTAGLEDEKLDRKQGDIEAAMLPDLPLSPDFSKTGLFIRPGVRWKLSTPKTNLTLSMLSDVGKFGTILNDDAGIERSYFYIDPGLTWEYNYRSGRRLMLEYSTVVNTPRASQLLPVVNNLNPLSLFYGKRELKPEYMQNGRLTWWLFDQFSFTTLLASVNFRYTRDKIGYSATTGENLIRSLSFLNVKDDLISGAMIDFSTPVKPLGLKINLVLDETYNRGISYINDIENINNSLIHRISLTVGNRKKEKWDVETGAAVTLTSTRYSVQKELNNNYNEISWFTEVRYQPVRILHFMSSADITKYTSAGFGDSRFVPLINAEASWYVLKNLRGTLTLAGVDLLNRNTGIERLSQMNTLSERRSSILGRYVMLSFKYRLNKMGDNKGGIDIQVKKR